MKAKKIAQALFGVSLIALPLLAGAALPPPPTGGNINNIDQLVCRLREIVIIIFWIFIVVAILFVIVAAFRYLTSGGDPEKVKKANWSLGAAAIAIVVGVIAWFAPAIVSSFVGVSLSTLSCP